MNKLAIIYPFNLDHLQNFIKVYINQITTNHGKQKLLAMLRHNNFINLKLFQENFLTNCIKICLSLEMKEYFQNQIQFCSSKTQENIRKYYYEKFTQGVWKNQFQFQQFIVILTKLIAQFFLRTFLDFKIDQNFESQIYVILIFTLLGTKVSVKVFPLLSKKYLKSQIKDKLLDTSNIDKTKQNDKFIPKPLKFKKKTRSRQSLTCYCPGSINPLSDEKAEINWYKNQSIDEFKKGLKQNLYIIPLQKVVRQKKALQFYTKQRKQVQKNQQQPKLEKQKSLVNKLPKFNHLSHSLSSNNSINSNTFNFGQLSSSMHDQLLKRHVSEQLNNKAYKTKQRNMFHSKGYILLKNCSSNQSKGETNLKNQNDFKIKEKQRLNSNQWKLVINNIRQQYSGIKQKNDRNKSFYRGSDFDNTTIRYFLVKQNTNQNNKHESQQKLLKKHQVWKQKGNLNNNSQQQKTLPPKLLYEVKDRHQLMEIESNQNIKFNQKNNLNKKNMLKEMKKSFHQDSIKRYQKINYSMFLLPSVKNKQTIRQFQR